MHDFLVTDCWKDGRWMKEHHCVPPQHSSRSSEFELRAASGGVLEVVIELKIGGLRFSARAAPPVMQIRSTSFSCVFRSKCASYPLCSISKVSITCWYRRKHCIKKT